MVLPAIKRELEAILLNLSRSAESGELPSQQDTQSFNQLAIKMHMNAPDEWASEAEDFLHLARQLHLAVKRESIQESVLLLDALRDAQQFCHRTYRDQD